MKKHKKKTFYGQTDGRTTQNYSSEPHKKMKIFEIYQILTLSGIIQTKASKSPGKFEEV